MQLILTVVVVALAGTFLFPLNAHAGQSCEPAKPTAAAVMKSMQLAERTVQQLDASGAKVVFLARAGQDLSKYGLRYSHLGLAYRTNAGTWRVVHKLNLCGTAVAAVYRQGLGEFFLDDLWRYEAAWIVPTPSVQAQLLAALNESPARIIRLHTAPYSVVSYAWGLKYQPLTRLGGRVGSANVAFDDHPNEKRFSDRIETVTVDSVFAWMPRTGLGAAPVVLKL
ncbi:MAG TPA: DUF2145 domain-containing protein [Steroidobacteraceae bacterium]